LKACRGKVLVIDEAYNLHDGLYGKQVLDTLVEKIQGTPNDDIAVLLLGYEEQMATMLREQNPGLARRFPLEYAFRFEDYTPSELITIFSRFCADESIRISPEVIERASSVLERQRNLPNFGNAGAVKNLIQSASAKAALRKTNDGKVTLLPDDIEIVSAEKRSDPLAPLNSLFNVEKIKEEFTKIQNEIRLALLEGEEQPEVGHFVFQGPPGTGKTTVARVAANILFDMGILAAPRVVETSGLNLTAEYVGQTKKKVTEKMEEAKGCVLFIDEAYKLGEGIYGEEALVTILAGMTSSIYKGMVIIIAGYEGDLNVMLNRNEGLKSRFNRYINFEAWRPDDCVAFLSSLAREKEFLEFSPRCGTLLRNAFLELQSLPGWANGRDVKDLWKKITSQRANRVSLTKISTKKEILYEDIEGAVEEMLKQRDSKVMPKNPGAPQMWPPQQPAQAHFHAPPPPKVVQQVQVEEEEEGEEEADVEEIEDEEEEAFFLVARVPRDAGVTDAEWEELEQAKKEHEEKMERIKREKDIAARAAALKAEQERQRATQEAIRRICPCPAGFAWYQVGGGWRCGGGSHLVTDEQLKRHFTHIAPSGR
jgi:DNA polymerase III delta prime subunit